MNEIKIQISDVINKYHLNPDVFKKSANFFIQVHWIKQYARDVYKVDYKIKFIL